MRTGVVIAALAALAGCSKEPDAKPAGSGGERVNAATVVEKPEAGAGAGFVPLADPPIAFFDQACARCHGPFGSFYGDAFAALNTDRSLHGVVLEMVEGPANAHLDDKSLFAQVAFHRSLRDGTPFGVVTKLTEDEIAGEMTPGTRVSVVTASGVIEAEMGEATWRAALPPSPPGGSAGVRVRVSRDGRLFEFDPREQAWSDAPPPTTEG